MRLVESLDKELSEVGAEARNLVAGGQTALAALGVAIRRLGHAALVADDGGKLLLANEAASRLTGYSLDELLRLAVTDLTPQLLESHSEMLWLQFITEGRQAGDYRVLGKHERVVTATYVAEKNLLPGLHVSLLASL